MQPAVKPADIPGRGRAVVAARTISPGEVILSDSPLLLYPASFPNPPSFCHRCFRSLNPSSSPPIPCPSSCSAFFCSPLCLSSHPLPLCSSIRLLLSSIPSSPSPETLSQLHFLAAAHALSISSPSDFARLLSLQGDPVTSSVPLPSPFPPDLTSALLAKDRINAFGLMEPLGSGGERRVRAYGIYPVAAMFNHDCLPNACRFDYVDRMDGGGNNTDIIIRAIHEISEGREVCLSYFPVNWGYKERQRRLLEEYGFRCECERCLVEKDWKDDEDGVEEEMGEGSGGDDEGMEAGEGEEEENDFPHAFFFVKFVCDREDCGGTLAPLPPSPEGQMSDVIECNVCGQLRKDEDVDGDGDMIDED